MPQDPLAPLLGEAVRVADAPNVRAVVLLGSLSRGEASEWSDVDVERWIEPGTDAPDPIARYVAGRLLAISTSTIDEVHSQLEVPEHALWAVPAYRSMRVLLDRRGDAAAVQQAVNAFSWESLRPAADRFVNITIAKTAEFVLKIRAASAQRDEWAALHAAGSLIGRCARIVSVARGTFIPTENAYYQIVCEAAGPAWARSFREAFALTGAFDAYAQAGAACRLYGETAKVVAERLDADARAVVERTMAAVA